MKETPWFKALNFVNGLVAPSFLFISGFAFVLSTRGKTEDLRKFDYTFWKKLGRILLIIIAGYSLHLPILSLRRLMHFYSQDVLISFYNVDILQCIGFGLLFLFLTRLLFKTDKSYNIFLIAFTAAIILFSPLVWQTDFSKFMAIPIANYFNSDNGSFFPLFPWLGFLFAGAVASKYYIEAREKNLEKKFIVVLTIIGISLALLGHILLTFIFDFPYQIVRPNPIFFFQRLGYVFFLLGLCWYYAEARKTKASFVLDVGRESLIVYWLHLQLIYRRLWNDQSFASVFGDKAGVIESLAATLILAVLMIAIAKFWGNFKKNHRPLAANLTLGLVSACIIIFLIGF